MAKSNKHMSRLEERNGGYVIVWYGKYLKPKEPRTLKCSDLFSTPREAFRWAKRQGFTHVITPTGVRHVAPLKCGLAPATAP